MMLLHVSYVWGPLDFLNLWVHNFYKIWKNLVIIYSNIISVFLLSPVMQGLCYICFRPLEIVSQVMDALFLFLSICIFLSICHV